MKAIVLAAGYGTRLSPLTLRIPKVMIPVAGRPVIAHILEQLRDSGISDVIINISKQQKIIKNYLGNGKKFGVKIKYVYKPEKKNSELGVLSVIEYIFKKAGIPERCLIIAGDNYFYGLDLKKFASQLHENASAKIALYTLNSEKDVEHFGVVALDEKGRITKFQEKPSVEKAVSRLASTAIYTVKREFIEKHLPTYLKQMKMKGGEPDRLGDVWEYYVDKLSLYGQAFDGIWEDIGNFEAYIRTNKTVMRLLQNDLVKKGTKVKVNRNATLSGPIILDEGAEIDEGAVVGPFTYLGKNVRVGKNSKIVGSIVLDGAEVGEHVTITDAVVDEGAKIGDNCKIENYACIGWDAEIEYNTRILPRSKIWPKIRVLHDAVVDGIVVNTTKFGSNDRRYWK